MMECLLKYKQAEIRTNPNYLLIPVQNFDRTLEGAREFNQLIEQMEPELAGYAKINRTPSGGISHQHIRLPAYDIIVNKSFVEYTVLDIDGMIRLQFRTKFKKEEGDIPGRTAFMRFKRICQKYGIDLDKYVIENGAEVKAQIPAPLSAFAKPWYSGMIFDDAHHVDFNSSHLSGLVEALPEFEPPIREIYEGRKKSNTNKATLTHSFGFMQSRHVGYRWAHLSKIMLERTNRVVKEMSVKLENAGRVPLLYNTDGIWYAGDVYHDETEGGDLGQWKNDHTHCKLRIKGPKSYEYIEEGAYHVVLSGQTKYDLVKPRSEWVWGDIYREDCNPLKFEWDENKRRIMLHGKVVK